MGTYPMGTNQLAATPVLQPAPGQGYVMGLGNGQMQNNNLPPPATIEMGVSSHNNHYGSQEGKGMMSLAPQHPSTVEEAARHSRRGSRASAAGYAE